MKVQIKIESLGTHVRLSIPQTADEVTENQFRNLAWVCSDYEKEENFTSFITTRKTLASAVKAFRSYNRFKTHNKNQNSPFEFINISQFNSNTPDNVIKLYAVGEYQDHKDVWAGYKPRIEKHFDKQDVA